MFIALQTTGRLGVAFIAMAIPIYAMSLVLYRYVEKPGIALGRRMLQHPRHQPNPSSP